MNNFQIVEEIVNDFKLKSARQKQMFGYIPLDINGVIHKFSTLYRHKYKPDVIVFEGYNRGLNYQIKVLPHDFEKTGVYADFSKTTLKIPLSLSGANEVKQLTESLSSLKIGDSNVVLLPINDTLLKTSLFGFGINMVDMVITGKVNIEPSYILNRDKKIGTESVISLPSIKISESQTSRVITPITMPNNKIVGKDPLGAYVSVSINKSGLTIGRKIRPYMAFIVDKIIKTIDK